MAHKPIDPLRMRLFSELNIQLAPQGIDKDTLNETSKHLAFLTRYYLNTPNVNPLQASVPIVTMGVRTSIGSTNLVHKIALVIHLDATAAAEEEGGCSTSPTATTASSTTDQEGKAPKTTSNTSKKIDGRHPSHFGPVGPATPPARVVTAAPSPSPAVSAKPRVRVLIQMINPLGHCKCLVRDFTSQTERVVAGILSGDEYVLRAAEEAMEQTQTCKGGKKGCARGAVWDLPR